MLRPVRISMTTVKYENIVVEIPADEEQCIRSSPEPGTIGAGKPTTTSKSFFGGSLFKRELPLAVIAAVLFETIQHSCRYLYSVFCGYDWILEVIYEMWRKYLR